MRRNTPSASAMQSRNTATKSARFFSAFFQREERLGLSELLLVLMLLLRLGSITQDPITRGVGFQLLAQEIFSCHTRHQPDGRDDTIKQQSQQNRGDNGSQ